MKPLLAACLLAFGCGGLRSASPIPSAEEQTRFVDATRLWALGYARALPDFLCTQTVRRLFVNTYRGDKLLDTLTIEVSFENHSERYALTKVNGLPTDMDYLGLQGNISTGEFGSVLIKVFGANSEFHFKNWTTIRKRQAAVYTYKLTQAEARYQLNYWDSNRHKLTSAMAGLHGDLVIDRDTHRVVRIDYSTDSLPTSFPLRATIAIEYDDVSLGEATYWLPTKAVVESTADYGGQRNEVGFHSYRRFTSDSQLKFEAPPPEL